MQQKLMKRYFLVDSVMECLKYKTLLYPEKKDRQDDDGDSEIKDINQKKCRSIFKIVFRSCQ